MSKRTAQGRPLGHRRFPRERIYNPLSLYVHAALKTRYDEALDREMLNFDVRPYLHELKAIDERFSFKPTANPPMEETP